MTWERPHSGYFWVSARARVTFCYANIWMKPHTKNCSWDVSSLVLAAFGSLQPSPLPSPQSHFKIFQSKMQFHIFICEGICSYAKTILMIVEQNLIGEVFGILVLGLKINPKSRENAILVSRRSSLATRLWVLSFSNRRCQLRKFCS